MDGLSNVATILQIGGTALTTLRALFEYVNAVKGANKSRSTVVEEVKSFRRILSDIKDIKTEYERQSVTGGPVSSLSHLWMPDGPLTQCDKVSSDLLAQLGGEGVRMNNLNFLRKLSWPSKVKEIMKEVKKLRHCKNEMSLFLQTITLYGYF